MKPPSAQTLELPIFVIRDQRVILDADLARIYGVTTKRLNEAVKRNKEKFPTDFAFHLTRQEVFHLRTRATTSETQVTDRKDISDNWSQFATGSTRHRSIAQLPWAFSEHGVIMAANILRSPRAIQMSVYVVRAFVKQREQLAANAAILKRLVEIDKTLLEHDGVLREIWTQLQPLLAPPPAPPKPRIGFATAHGK